MSESLFGAFGNPVVQGLLGLSSGFGQAAMPSRMPIPLGAAFGMGASGMSEAMTNAQKLRMLMEQEKRLNAQTALDEQKLELERGSIQRTNDLMGKVLPMISGQGDQGQIPQMSPAQPDMPAQPSNYTPPANAQEFIKRFAPQAMAAAQETGLDPRLILAQAGLESGWGSKAPGNNFFGIKGQGQTLQTQESVNGQMVPQQASFRAYGSPEESFRDYAAFIKANPRYGSVMGAQGLDAQIDAMGKSGYATDPNYAGKLRMLARGIQLPEGAQPAAAPQQSAQATAQPAPISVLPPAAQNAVRARATQSEEQARRYYAMSVVAASDPRSARIAPILQELGKQSMERGAWVEERDPETGRRIMYHMLTGDKKAHPLDEQFTLSPGQSRFNPNGTQVASLPHGPMAPVPMMRNGQPALVEPVSREVVGQPILTPDQIQALPYQPGATQPTAQPNTAVAPLAGQPSPAAAPAPQTAASQAEAFNASMARKTGEEALQREQGQTVSKTLGELMAARNTAYDNLRNYRQFATLMKDFETGKFSGAKMEVGKVLQAAGIPDSIIPSGIDRKAIASAETMAMITNKMAMSMIGPGGLPANNFSEADRDYITRTVSNLQNTPGGNSKIMELGAAVEQRKLAIGNAWAEWRSKNGNTMNSYLRFETTEIPRIKEMTPLPQIETGSSSQTQSGPIRINSSADYEAVPKGATYIDPTGIPRVKR